MVGEPHPVPPHRYLPLVLMTPAVMHVAAECSQPGDASTKGNSWQGTHALHLGFEGSLCTEQAKNLNWISGMNSGSSRVPLLPCLQARGLLMVTYSCSS